MGTSDMFRGYYVVLVYWAYISSNVSHFLTAGFLRYWTHEVWENWFIRVYFEVLEYCTYKLKWKPLFDGWVLGVHSCPVSL